MMSYKDLYSFVSHPEYPGENMKARMNLAPLVRKISQYGLTDINVIDALEKCYKLDMEKATTDMQKECYEFEYTYFAKYLDESFADIILSNV